MLEIYIHHKFRYAHFARSSSMTSIIMFSLLDLRAWRAYQSRDMLPLLDLRAWRAYQSRDMLARLSSTSSSMRVTISRVSLILIYPLGLVTLGPLFTLSSRKYGKCLLRKATIEHPLNESNSFSRTLGSCQSTYVLASLVPSRTNNACSTTRLRSASHVLHQESLVILPFLLSLCEEFTKNECVFETKCAKRKRSYNA